MNKIIFLPFMALIFFGCAELENTTKDLLDKTQESIKQEISNKVDESVDKVKENTQKQISDTTKSIIEK